MNIVEVMKNHELLDELIVGLDNVARDVNSYEYGLPTYDDGALSRLREVIVSWLAEVGEIETHTEREQGLSTQAKQEVEEIVLHILEGRNQ